MKKEPSAPFSPSPVSNGNIDLMIFNTAICGTYNLALVYKALKAMSAPARDTRDCKYRGEKLLGQSEHLIHESAVKVYIRAYTFIYAALLRNKLGMRCLPCFRKDGILSEVLFLPKVSRHIC